MATWLNIKGTPKWQLKQVKGLVFHKTKESKCQMPRADLQDCLLLHCPFLMVTKLLLKLQPHIHRANVTRGRTKARGMCQQSPSIFIGKTVAFPGAPPSGLLWHQNFAALPSLLNQHWGRESFPWAALGHRAVSRAGGIPTG